MKKYKYYTILFALAVILAGVFATLGISAAYAEQVIKPWNITAVISYKGDSFEYCLENHIQNVLDEADSRGFYLGFRGRKRLSEQLLCDGLPSMAVYEYIIPDFSDITEHFSYVNKEKIDAEVLFSSNGFSYTKPQDGVEINCAELFDAMIKSGGKRVEIVLPLSIDKAITIDDLKKNTVKKGSFTTTYYQSGVNRSYNIALATKTLDGITIKPDETFSFNDVVGARTEANGYKNAKVILDGAYTDGVGGGVCQVSTTLYNALLLSGFIPRACQHSLVSGYVMAGFDAMVAYGSSDLTFVNNTSHNIYIQGKTHGKSVTFTIYGEPNEYDIKRENTEQRDPFETVRVVDRAKYPDLIYVDQEKVIKNGSDGVKTKSYLKYYKNGVLVNTRLIRSNNYKRVDKVIACGDLPRPADYEPTEQISENNGI